MHGLHGRVALVLLVRLGHDDLLVMLGRYLMVLHDLVLLRGGRIVLLVLGSMLLGSMLLGSVVLLLLRRIVLLLLVGHGWSW